MLMSFEERRIIMLRRILTAAIAVLLTVTGLILMEQLLPQISYFLGYNIHSTGLLGYSYIHWLFAIVSVLFFGWIGWVITPFLIKFLLKYSEIVASVLAKAPSADIIVSLIGVLVGLILANLIGAPFSRLPIVGPYIPVVLSIVLALTGAKVASHKSKDILDCFTVPGRKERTCLPGQRKWCRVSRKKRYLLWILCLLSWQRQISFWIPVSLSTDGFRIF